MGLNQRRLRMHSAVRELTREVRLSHQQFIQPLFVVENLREREAVPSLTGVFRETETSLLKQIEADLEKGIRKFLLFPVPAQKAERDFSSQFAASQIEAIKKSFGKDLFLSIDVCLCSATTHGHCGVLTAEQDHVNNSLSVAALSDLALAYAQAGVDCVAPSDMMDGRIGSIRRKLDAAGQEHRLILSYSAKFHSRFYGPFRVAADSAPKGGSLKDRATYQIEPGSYMDALESSRRDAEEGADLLMVKPGLPYLDVLYRLSQEIHKPWVVYEVSGEYGAIEALAEKGLVSAPDAHVESWIAFARAGASAVISYGARNSREWIDNVENRKI